MLTHQPDQEGGKTAGQVIEAQRRDDMSVSSMAGVRNDSPDSINAYHGGYYILLVL